MTPSDFTDQFARLEHANQRGEELGVAIQTWAAGKPCTGLGEVDDDRLGWRLSLRVGAEPPLCNWSLIFSDAVSQLRSSLDNLAMAINDGPESGDPKSVKRVKFPIASSEEEWRSDRTWIQHFPTRYFQRIENVQPFNRVKQGGVTDGDLLLILRKLSNADKHYLQVRPILQPQKLSHEFSIEFETEADAALSVPPDVEVFGAAFRDGEVLLHQKTKGRIAKILGNYQVALEVQIIIEEKSYKLTEILAALCYYTGVVIRYVTTD